MFELIEELFDRITQFFSNKKRSKQHAFKGNAVSQQAVPIQPEEGVSMLTSRNVIIGSVLAILVVAVLWGVPNAFENLDAKQIMVIQSPIEGKLEVFTDPGVKWQGWGKVTTYPRREQFSFSTRTDQGKSVDESISTRFNDGGHGNISGVVSWEMPLSTEAIIRLHKEFGSFHAIEQQLIRPMIEKVVYNIGPTMSSTESSAEKRPEIPQYMDDQLQNGPYLTETKSVVQKDPITGQDKTVNIVSIVKGSDGQPRRSAPSQIRDYGIKMFPVTINNIKYDGVVEKQIAERQQATTQVQIAIANSQKAEQDAKTIAKQGEATAAKAKWEQETIKAKEVTRAEQEKAVAVTAAEKVRDVAKLEKDAAEFTKQKEILLGQGESERRRLVMSADGALEKKLEAYVKVQEAYATAIQNYKGNWVPTTVMGSSGAANSNGAMNLLEIIGAKAAKDLAADVAPGKPASK